MPYYFLVRTPEIIAHLAEHDFCPSNLKKWSQIQKYEDMSGSTGNPVAFGSTSAGRRLCCVFKRFEEDLIEPVTAYDVGER